MRHTQLSNGISRVFGSDLGQSGDYWRFNRISKVFGSDLGQSGDPKSGDYCRRSPP